MDLKDFTYLVTLAEQGSISRAADQLFMAQSSLSQFLQQFESELGVKLFIRTSRGIRPTSNGAVFIGHLKKLMEDYRRAKNELWDNENMKGGKLTFGISSFRGRRMAPLILKKFSERYPDVQIDVVEENSMKLEELLLEGQLDLAVIALPPAKLKQGTIFIKNDEVLMVANRRHPIMDYVHPKADGSGYWVDMKDAARFGFILSDHNTILGTIGRNLFKREKLPCQILHGTITAALAVSMASEGLGLAFTYASSAEQTEDAVFLSVGEEGFFMELGLAYPSEEYHSKAVRALEEVIREIYLGQGL